MSNLKIFAEFGIGNSSLCSTEIEKGNREHRVRGFLIPAKIEAFYIRVWIGKRVYALSTNKFFNIKKKDRKKFKLIFGIEGRRRDDKIKQRVSNT